jgi:tRNA1Val (adenine37-N6)-methyltransferase
MLPAKRKKEVEALLQSSSLFLNKICSVKQTVAHEPFRLLLAGSFTKIEEPEISILSIRDQDNQYTREFITLLREYYLHL